MPKTQPRIAALKPAPLEDILEDLKGVDFDVRNVAAMLEVTVDRANHLEREEILEAAARWLTLAAHELEMARGHLGHLRQVDAG
jgi:hypothetical protein